MSFLQIHKFIFARKNLFFLTFSIVFLLGASPSVFSQKKYTIVIDAGHGGKDPGNLGNAYREKDIALKVALQVGKLLKSNKDLKIIFTRKNDVFIDLWKRGAIANEAKATLFVSIHCDSHTSNAHGAGTFVLGLRGNKKNLEIAKRENAVILMEDNYANRYEGFDSNSAESVIGLTLLQEENLDKSLEVANLMQQNFTKRLHRLDRKVKQDNFQVLRETIMPSVLIELGFLTNKTEGRFLNSRKGQLLMSTMIADAINAYIKHLELNTIQENDEVVANINKVDKKIQYKVQIAAGKNKIALKSYNFKGLKNVEVAKIGKYFKYFYGKTKQYDAAFKKLKYAKKAGFKTAFLVAFKNNKIIPLSEALKMD